MKKLIVIGSALLLTSAAWAQTQVTTGVMRGKEYGVTYMLPQTEIEFVLTLSKHTFTPGEFCKYADRYLRLKDVKAEAQTYWTVDAVTARGVGKPNKDKVYFVLLKDKTVAPLMELTTDGVVRSINLPMSGLAHETEPQSPTAQEPETDPRSYLTEEILMANSSAKMAELIAKEIYLIRESRNALLRGEADNSPKDGAQLKLMLDNLNRQEQAMTSLFAGKERIQTTTQTIRITPENMEQKVVFRFSKQLGLVDADDLAGEPYLLTIKDLGTPAVTGELPKKEPEGVAYNVPGRARVTLTHNNRTCFDEELPVTQFGSVEYLAPVLFNKNTTTTVQFDTTTGGIIKVNREEKQ